MITCIIGSAVSGDELFGRESELNEIWESITHGSVLLVSPRRFGKTSIVFDMKKFPRNNYDIFYLDVEYLEDPGEFIVEILDKTKNLKDFKTKFKDGFEYLKNSIEEIGILDLKVKLREDLKTNWESKGNHIFEKLSGEESQYVFVVDELPSMLQNIIKNNGIEKAKLFLNWMRQLRAVYNIKFIICGSIGIDQILNQCDAVETINDLKRILIPPLSKPLAKDMIKELLDGFQIKYDDNKINEIYQQVGTGVPFFIKILVQAISHKIAENKSDLTTDIINKAYNEMVLGVSGRGYFEHYFTRLDAYYKNGTAYIAKRILDHLAIHGTSSSNELKNIFFKITKSNNIQAYTELIKRLEDDFYIFLNDSKQYQFYTGILQDLWRQRRGLG